MLYEVLHACFALSPKASFTIARLSLLYLQFSYIRVNETVAEYSHPFKKSGFGKYSRTSDVEEIMYVVDGEALYLWLSRSPAFPLFLPPPPSPSTPLPLPFSSLFPPLSSLRFLLLSSHLDLQPSVSN